MQSTQLCVTWFGSPGVVLIMLSSFSFPNPLVTKSCSIFPAVSLTHASKLSPSASGLLQASIISCQESQSIQNCYLMDFSKSSLLFVKLSAQKTSVMTDYQQNQVQSSWSRCPWFSGLCNLNLIHFPYSSSLTCCSGPALPSPISTKVISSFSLLGEPSASSVPTHPSRRSSFLFLTLLEKPFFGVMRGQQIFSIQDYKYFQLCGPYNLCCNFSPLIVQGKQHRQYINVWLCSKKTIYDNR